MRSRQNLIDTKSPALRHQAVWLTAAITLLLATGEPVRADRLPLWELAAGGVGLHVPVYRGAEESRSLVLPFVYPVYRGHIWRVDDEGARGLLFSSDRVNVELSLDGNIPADSDDIDRREGMPDLDPTVQLGPSLEFELWNARSARQQVRLNLPLRAVFTVDIAGSEAIGFAASPHVRYNRSMRFLDRPWRLRLSAGLEFGTEAFHDYYYQVDSQFDTPERAAYDAEAGYGGTRMIFTLTSRHPRGANWLSLFARHDQIDGAVFADSPLVSSSDGLTIGFVYAHLFARSKTLVDATDFTGGKQN